MTSETKHLEEEIRDLRLTLHGPPGEGGGMRGEIDDLDKRLSKLEDGLNEISKTLEAQAKTRQRAQWIVSDTIISKVTSAVLIILSVGVISIALFVVKRPDNSLTGGNISITDDILRAGRHHKQYLNVADVAQDYNVTPDTVRRWISEGRVIPKPFKSGRYWQISPDYIITPDVLIPEGDLDEIKDYDR